MSSLHCDSVLPITNTASDAASFGVALVGWTRMVVEWMAQGVTQEKPFSRAVYDGEGTPEPFGTAVRSKRNDLGGCLIYSRVQHQLSSLLF